MKKTDVYIIDSSEETCGAEVMPVARLKTFILIAPDCTKGKSILIQ